MGGEEWVRSTKDEVRSTKDELGMGIRSVGITKARKGENAKREADCGTNYGVDAAVVGGSGVNVGGSAIRAAPSTFGEMRSSTAAFERRIVERVCSRLSRLSVSLAGVFSRRVSRRFSMKFRPGSS